MSAENPAAPHDTTDGPADAIRLLVLDIDGTVNNSRHEIEDATVEAVGRIRAAGIGVMLATGRRYRDVLPVAARLGLDGALVTASGALVKRPPDHVTLSRAAFDPGTLAVVLDRIVRRGHEPILYTDSFAEGFDFHCRALPTPTPGAGPAGVAEYLALNRHLARLDPDLAAMPPAGVFAGFTMGGRDAMLDLERELTDACPGQLSLHVIRSPRYRDWMCEIAPRGVTKWSGVLAIATAAGIGPETVCAVGDDVNDLPMIRGAGWGVAMGNATAEVQAAADRVVASNDAGGIVELADLILARRGKGRR